MNQKSGVACAPLATPVPAPMTKTTLFAMFLGSSHTQQIIAVDIIQ